MSASSEDRHFIGRRPLPTHQVALLAFSREGSDPVHRSDLNFCYSNRQELSRDDLGWSLTGSLIVGFARVLAGRLSCRLDLASDLEEVLILAPTTQGLTLEPYPPLPSNSPEPNALDSRPEQSALLLGVHPSPWGSTVV